ncbi:MAG: apolipoprotein N-acyltransferase [Desulforhopalus sp.]
MTFLKRSSFLLSLLTPCLLWAALPGTIGGWAILLFALVPLFMVLGRGDSRHAAYYGLVSGILHYILLLYWIVIVVGKYGGLPWYISIFSLLGLAVYMSLYLVLFCVAARSLLATFHPAICLWLLPSLWVGIDWGRSILFTGLPWMDLGYGLFDVPILIQVADLVGHHGVSFLIVLINCLIFLLITGGRSVKTTAVLLVPVLCLLAGAGYYSKVRLGDISRMEMAADTPALRVGIVQGNIDQSVKWSPAHQRITVEKYLEQTQALAKEGNVSLVVWPETALPFYPPNTPLMVSLEQEVAALGLSLITGAPWYEVVNLQQKEINFYNSAVLLRPDRQPGGRYNKSHLVPFGEYIPLKKYLPFLAPLVEAVGDFSFGTIDRPLSWLGAKAGVLICFESVFPELSRRWVNRGANVLINLTNDAWYGKSSAPYQSLAMSVLRAVESRRSLVRSANTGVSAFISPSGKIIDRSEIFVPWAAAVDVVLLEEETVWVRYGYLFAPGCLILGVAAMLVCIYRRQRSKPRKLKSEFGIF